jgi:hypothetical protein
MIKGNSSCPEGVSGGNEEKDGGKISPKTVREHISTVIEGARRFQVIAKK